MLNTVIIGCGTVVEELYQLPLKRLIRSGAIKLVGLVDRDESRLERLGKLLHCDRRYRDLALCLASNGVDVVLITSPASLHAEHAIQSIEKGAHVFCEKPLAISSEEIQRIAEAGRSRQRCIGVGMARRFYPNLAEIRSRILSRELPGPIRFSLVEGGFYGWPIASDGAFRRSSSRGGGGVLLDVGSHTLDTLVWLFGVPRVTSCEDDAMGTGVEANVRLNLDFAEASGSLQLSWDQPLNSELRISGPKWAIRLNNLEIVRYEEKAAGGSWGWRTSAMRWPADVKSRPLVMGQPQCYYDCFDYQLVSFLRSVLHDEPVAVKCDEAASVLEAIGFAYAQARPLELPWLSSDEASTLKAGHWRVAQ